MSNNQNGDQFVDIIIDDDNTTQPVTVVTKPTPNSNPNSNTTPVTKNPVVDIRVDIPPTPTPTKNPNIDTKLINKIKKKLIEPTYYQDTQASLKGRWFWKKTGDFMEAFGQIFSGIASILAFAAGFFGLNVLSFVAGCCGTISLVLLHFSSYAMKESRNNTAIVNKILALIGLTAIPDIVVDTPDTIEDPSMTPTVPLPSPPQILPVPL